MSNIGHREQYATRLRKLAEDVESGRAYPGQVRLTYDWDAAGQSYLSRVDLSITYNPKRSKS